MYHPGYAWLSFNWFLDNWWMENTTCTIESSIDPASLERIVRTSLSFGHFPVLDDEYKDEINQANIVSMMIQNNYVLKVKYVASG